MIKVGVTGGIGSGKSTVCKIFQVLGIPVFNADGEARRLMEEDKALVGKIKVLFGTDAYSGDKLNRQWIAAQVFKDKSLLNRLNAFVHPVVGKQFIRWAAAQKDVPYLVKEAAILFESGAEKGLDYVVFVKAPEKLRIKRIMQRDGVTELQVRQRMQNQWPDEKKEKCSDFVLVNDDKQMVLPQAIQLHNHLLALAGANTTQE